jgi:hypothetical protein
MKKSSTHGIICTLGVGIATVIPGFIKFADRLI